MTRRRQEILDGAVFLAGSVGLLALVPRANALRKLLPDDLAAPALLVALVALALLAVAVVRRPGAARRQSLVALALLAVVAAVTAPRVAPVARFHLLGFAVVSVLAYRWLRHRLPDRGVHLAAAALTALVGLVDEAWQWWIPGRFWDLGDIAVDAAVGLWTQLALAWVIRPPATDRPTSRRTLRIGLRFTAAALLALFLSLVNTPPRIEAYADRLPGTAHLGAARSTRMVEYGHRIVDPEVGLFRSRLTADDLRRADRDDAPAAARRLAAHVARGYAAVQREVVPGDDPLAYEAYVHLFYRDRLWQRAFAATDETERRDLATRAFREALLLERWFGETLARSGYTLDPERRRRTAALHDPGAAFESEVSDWLVTAFSERQARWSLLALLAVVLVAERRLGRSPRE